MMVLELHFSMIGIAAVAGSSEEEPERRVTDFLGGDEHLDDLERGSRRRRAWLHIIEADDDLLGSEAVSDR